jgi:hypothetical protein
MEYTRERQACHALPVPSSNLLTPKFITETKEEEGRKTGIVH